MKEHVGTPSTSKNGHGTDAARLPASTDSASSSAVIQITRDEVTIEQLVVDDPYVAEQVRLAGDEQAERAKRVALLLEGGARVATLGSSDIMLRRVQEALTAATRDLVHERDAIGEMIRMAKHEFQESLQSVFREQLGDEARAGFLSQVFHQSTEAFMTELSGQLTGFKGEFDEGRTDNITAKLKKTLSASCEKAISDLRTSLTSEDPQNPLGKLVRGQADTLESLLHRMKLFEETVTQRLIEIAEKVARETARNEERRRSSAKGRDFEAVIFDELWTLASPYGDIVVDVTDIGGPNGKGGDYVVSIAADHESRSDPTVVWEAKNVGSSMSFNAAVKALAGAMNNRGAGVGVLVFAHRDQMPGRDGPFMLLGDRMIACCYDADSGDNTVLKVAYRLSRLLALASLRPSSVDAAAIGTAVAQLNAGITALSVPRTHLRDIRRRADEALAALSDADAALNEASQCLARMLCGGAPSPPTV